MGEAMSAAATGLVTLVSLLMIGMGLCGLFAPAALSRGVSFWRSKAGLWAAGAVRAVFGVALWAAAPRSHTPLALQALGAVSLVSGCALPLIGPARFGKLIDWFLGRSAALIRGWCLAAALLGAFVLWSVSA